MTAGQWSATIEGMWLPHSQVGSQLGRGRRILHLATRFLRGGAERNIAHSVAWERAAGFEVELAFGPDADTAGIPPDIPTHLIPKLVRSVGPRDAAAVWQVRQLIRAGRFDIVHTHLSKAGIVGRLAGRGVADRVIHTVHMSSFGPGYSRAASTVYRTAERACSPMADTLVFVGTELRDKYVEAGVVPVERTSVIRSPIDLQPFLATRDWSGDRRQAARDALGIPIERPLLLTIGTLEPRKRHELIIRTLGAWLKERPGHLLIAGDGPLREPLSELAASLDLGRHVSFAGHVHDLTGSMAAADLLVHASAAEGVPQVVIQALAAGRPVVATEVVGLHEVRGAAARSTDRDGSTMVQAVDELLQEPPTTAPTSAFDLWECVQIDAQLHRLHFGVET